MVFMELWYFYRPTNFPAVYSTASKSYFISRLVELKQNVKLSIFE